MRFEGQWLHLIDQAAEALGVPVEWLRARQTVIDRLLSFFQSGELEVTPLREGQQMPSFVRPYLIRVGDVLLAVDTVQLSHHPLIPTIDQAFVSFFSPEAEMDVPSYRLVRSRDEVESDGSISFMFTSALSLEQNLVDFAATVLSPEPELSLAPGTPTMFELMEEHARQYPDD